MPDHDDTDPIEALATEAAGYFERATRDDESTYTRTVDGAPEWVTDLVYSAHGDFLPEDWRYACIEAVLDHLADGGDPEDPHPFADEHVDIYNAARLQWLASNLTRPGYVDEARAEGLIGPDADIMDQIGIGQYQEAVEVFGLVTAALERQRDEREQV